MSSANSLLPILRCLDEIERKLDRLLEELRTATAIGYSGGRHTAVRMILSSFDDVQKNRHFPIKNHEQQPQGLRKANQD
jgi:hypothetical protein